LSPQGSNISETPWLANYVEFLAGTAVELEQVGNYLSQIRSCVMRSL
jgi:hypothetical protein